MDRFPDKAKTVVEIILSLLCLAMLLVLVFEGWIVAIEETTVSDMLRIPQTPFRMALVRRLFFLCIRDCNRHNRPLKDVERHIMDPVIVGIIGMGIVFLLLALGMPIAFSLMLAGFTGIAFLSGIDAALPVSARAVYDEAATYQYMVIPLFIVMGSFAGASGMTKDIYGCLDKWLRLLPGGLAVASIAACAAFAAVSGSAVATTATLGNIALPEMKRYKYSDKLSTGAIAAGGTLGFLIPPSLGFVVYGMLTEQSIGKLLVAGMIPGYNPSDCILLLWLSSG